MLVYLITVSSIAPKNYAGLIPAIGYVGSPSGATVIFNDFLLQLEMYRGERVGSSMSWMSLIPNQWHRVPSKRGNCRHPDFEPKICSSIPDDEMD